jgi:hypothetical protein
VAGAYLFIKRIFVSAIAPAAHRETPTHTRKKLPSSPMIIAFITSDVSRRNPLAAQSTTTNSHTHGLAASAACGNHGLGFLHPAPLQRTR